MKLLEETEFFDDHRPCPTDHQYRPRLHNLYLQQLDLSRIKILKY